MQYTFWLGGYGFGMFDVLALVNAIVCWGWQEGKVSTGNSLDMTPQDEEHIKANDASVKDMEVSSNFTGYALSQWFSLDTDVQISCSLAFLNDSGVPDSTRNKYVFSNIFPM